MTLAPAPPTPAHTAARPLHPRASNTHTQSAALPRYGQAKWQAPASIAQAPHPDHFATITARANYAAPALADSLQSAPRTPCVHRLHAATRRHGSHAPPYTRALPAPRAPPRQITASSDRPAQSLKSYPG